MAPGGTYELCPAGTNEHCEGASFRVRPGMLSEPMPATDAETRLGLGIVPEVGRRDIVMERIAGEVLGADVEEGSLAYCGAGV